MASGDISSQVQLEQASPLKIWTILRLGLFQMSLGVMSVMVLGILNRIMINELDVPATLAAGAIAMHQFVAPARVWFGQLSDARPIWGKHRTGYIWLGAIGFCLAAFLAVQVMWGLGSEIQDNGLTGAVYSWVALLAVVFVGYGLALSASSTPFAALLVDVSQEEERSKLVGIVWSMLMVGIVISGITGSVFLSRLEDAPVVTGAKVGVALITGQEVMQASVASLQPPINTMFIIVILVVLGLTALATWGIEDRFSQYKNRSSAVDREDSITLGRAIRVLTASRQTGTFFTFLMIMTLSLFLQEAVLEPYGGEVFRMSIAATTRLNSYWGTGTLIGLLLTGFLVVPRLGKRHTAQLGCLAVAASFGLIILAGFSQTAPLLEISVLLFGLAAGVTTTGAISLMLDLTAAETAGTFIGAWGLAQAMARAIATVSGGAILDFGKAIFPTPTLAYALVFGLQALGMISAVWLLSRVDVREFQTTAKTAIAKILQEQLD